MWRIVRACTSWKAYASFSKDGLKPAFKTFMLAMLVAALVMSVAVGFGFFMLRNLAAASDFPTVIIDNGTLVSPTELWMSGNETSFIIDPKGQQEPPIEGFLLTKDRLVVKEKFKTTEYGLSQFAAAGRIEISKDTVTKWAAILAYVMIPLVLVMIFAFVGAWNLLYVLMLSVAGIIVNSSQNGRLRFSQLYALGLYAAVPMILYGGLLSLLGLWFQFSYTLIFLAFYIPGVVMAARRR